MTGIDSDTAVSAALMCAGMSSGALSRMHHPAHRRIVRRRHQAAEECVEIAPHVRVGIFLEEKRAGRMPHEDSEQPGSDAGVANEGRGPVGEFVMPGAGGGNG